MPRGTRHVETGILRVGRWGYELEMEGGGAWRLDVTGSVRRLIGHRVIVEGTRAGFDLLDVTRLRATDGIADERTWWARMAAHLSGR